MKLLDVKRLYEEYDKKDSEGLEAIGSMIYTQYKQQSAYNDEMAVLWDQIANFYEGRQHLVYDKSKKSYMPRPVTKYNRHIPRPVTNYIYPLANAIVSLLTKNRPRFLVTENSDLGEDVNRAKLTDAILDAKYEIDNEQVLHDWAMKCAVLLGTVYRKDYWDTTGLQTVTYDQEIKEEAGESSEEEIEDRYEDGEKTEKKVNKKLEKDDKEAKEKTEVPLGDNKCSMLTPFQTIVDYENAIVDMEDGYFAGDVSVQQISYVKALYNKKAKGYTGLAKEVKEEKDLSLKMDFFERLKGTSGSGYGEKPDVPNSTVLIEMYIRPDKKHPKGLMIVCAGNTVLYAYDSPYTYGDGVNWNPYTMFKYDLNPFKHHGGSVMEQLIYLQQRLNSIDAIQILNRKTMAVPQWTIPQNSMMPEQYPTGRPGELIPYKPGANGEKPDKVRGYPPDGS